MTDLVLAVPVRDEARWIAPLFRSLEDQGIQPRIALMDASSSDAVQTAAAPWHDRLALNRHGPDTGQSAAINEAWRRVPGEILAWINGDDLFYPNALDRAIEAFDQNPDVDIVCGHAAFIDQDGNFLGYFPAFKSDPSALFAGGSLAQPAVFIRRAAAEKVGLLDERLHYAMDWDFWRRLYHAGAQFHILDAPLAAMRQHAMSKTSQGGWPRLKEIFTVARRSQNLPGALRTLAGFWTQDRFDRGCSTLLALDQSLFQLRGRGFGEAWGRSTYCINGLGLDGWAETSRIALSWPRYEGPRQAAFSLVIEGARLQSIIFDGRIVEIKDAVPTRVPRQREETHVYHTEGGIDLPFGLCRIEIETNHPRFRLHAIMVQQG